LIELEELGLEFGVIDLTAIPACLEDRAVSLEPTVGIKVVGHDPSMISIFAAGHFLRKRRFDTHFLEQMMGVVDPIHHPQHVPHVDVDRTGDLW